MARWTSDIKIRALETSLCNDCIDLTKLGTSFKQQGEPSSTSKDRIFRCQAYTIFTSVQFCPFDIVNLKNSASGPSPFVCSVVCLFVLIGPQMYSDPSACNTDPSAVMLGMATTLGSEPSFSTPRLFASQPIAVHFPGSL